MHLNRDSSKDELTKCNLWRKIQRTQPWYRTWKHKTRYKSESCSFSTVLQALWHQKQTTTEPARSCDHSLSYLFLPSPLVKLAAAAAFWSKPFFSSNLSSPAHKEKQSSHVLSELPLLCFEAASNTESLSLTIGSRRTNELTSFPQGSSWRIC